VESCSEVMRVSELLELNIRSCARSIVKALRASRKWDTTRKNIYEIEK